MYQYHRKVQYHETDKMGITHHSNYIKWMEEARAAFLESVALPFQAVEEHGIVSPVAGLSISYKKPSTFGDEIVIEVDITKYSGVRLEIGYTMVDATTGVLIATAVSKHCFVKDDQIISLKRVEPELHRILERTYQDDCRHRANRKS